jgi:hypothetical protein
MSMQKLWMIVLVAAGTLVMPVAPAAAEEQAPPKLEVTTKPEPELTEPNYPGWTTLHVVAPVFWRVHVVVSTHDKTILDEEPQGESIPVTENEQIVPGPTEKAQVSVRWPSCATPNIIFSYTVTVANYGQEEMTTTGTFPGATQHQCEQARRTYLRDGVEEARRAQARKRRQRHEALVRLRRFEANCRTVGGTPVTIQSSQGPRRVCRSKTGGIVPA